MRPPRDDIAAPELPPRIGWIGDAPRRMSALTARGPVLVHFFDVAQLNSVRALPYVVEWERRYAPSGLTVLGVHSPRFAFTADRDLLTAELERLGVTHPVADDSRYSFWADYDPGGWPSLFLWGRGGALRWAHFGEGEYLETEREIAAALAAARPGFEAPAPIDPIRPADAEGALLRAPSPELFPGGSPREPSTETLEVEYEGGGVHAVLDGGGRLGISVDGEPAWELVPDRAGLHAIAEHGGHGRHTVLIEPRDGARIWALSFSPGEPVAANGAGA